MPLVKNKLPIPFSLGLETKSDDSQLQISGVTVLENTLFDNPNKVIKRNGYDIVTTKLIDNSEITGAKFLANFEDELGLLTRSNYYAQSDSLSKWTNKGNVFTAIPTTKPILRNSRQQKNLDVLNIENLSIITFEDSEGIKYSVVDNSNNNFLVSDSLLSASGIRPRVANIENIAYIFYIDSNELKFRKVNILTPQSPTTEQTLVSDVETSDNVYDVVTISDRIFTAYNSTTGGGSISLIYIDSGDVTSSVSNVAGEDASVAISTNTDESSRFIVSYSTGTEVKTLGFSFTLGVQVLPTTTIETISNAVNLNVIESTPASNTYTMFYEISGATDKEHYVKTNTVDLAGSIGTPSVVKRSVGLASKSFMHNDEVYTILIHSSTLQSTYFTVNSSGTIVSKISNNLGGQLIDENVLSKVESISDDQFIFVSQLKGRATIDDDQFFSLLGVSLTTLDFNPSVIFQNEKLGENLHIAGGFLQQYDGNEIVEHGFHVFPEDLTTGSDATTGGFMSDGEYQFIAVYAWTDNNGQLHRSAPSIGHTVTLAGGTNTQVVDINIPTLRLTQKTDVVIEIYRTEIAGTIFYKETEISSPLLNDPTVDSVTFQSSISDTDLIQREVLYTTGGVLDNIAAPSSTIIESFSDRIFLAGTEDQNKLIFSKIRFEGAPVEFSDILSIAVNSRGGKITALKTMDEKLIIFKESAVYYLSGDGPNNLGEQDTFIKPELVSSDIGCINVNSVVLTPIGLMFKSKKGIYLLERNLNLTYIGAGVEKFNDLTVSSAKVLSEENQVRFTTTTGDALVYNYFVRKWASFPNHRALSAVNIGFTYYYLRSDGILYKENETSYTDNGSPINMKVTTGWLSMAGVQGFQRIYKLLLLGEFKSPHKVKFSIAYDFNEAFVQEVVVDTADFNDNSRYGDDSPYGEPTTKAYGGDGNVHQMRIDLKRQKCQAIKIKIEEIQSDPANFGEGLSMSNLMIEVGQKIGVNKISTGRQYGTE
jgi:hypothetical protein